MRFHRMVFMMMLLVLLTGVLTVSAQDDDTVRPAWNGVSRFTVLVMGIDRRPGEALTFNYRSDAILLVSFDPASTRIGVLSIPRDTFFALPESGEMARVNTLLVLGESRQKGYGPLYAIDTLQYNLGIYIDTAVIFDFDAFIALIDALDGIEIDVTYAINDRQFPDMDYGYDPFSIHPGHHTFDGATALKYARTRHNDDDYQRGLRQLQVLTAVYEKVFDPATLPTLLPKIPELMRTVSGNLYSDLSAEELLNLAQAARAVPPDHLVMGALNKDYSIATIAPDGSSVRIPDRERLIDLMTTIFGDNYAH